MGKRLLQLGGAPEAVAPRLKTLIELLRLRSRAFLDNFGVFIGLSVLCHIAVFGVIAAQGARSVPSGADALRSNINAFAQAVMEREHGPAGERSGTDTGDLVGFADQAEAISSLLRFDKTISDRGKTDFFRSLLEAAEGVTHVPDDLPSAPDPSFSLTEALAGREKFVAPSSDAFFVIRNLVDDTVEVDALDRATLEKIEAMSPAEESTANDAARYGAASVPADYLLKKSPYAAISARGPRLFTVFRGFPEIAGDSTATPAASVPAARTNREVPQDPPASFVYLVARPAPSGDARGKTALILPAEERARVLDELMVMKNPEQLEAFMARYLDVYDPDQGDLAVLTREFFYSNLNNIFVLTNPVASTFDVIEGIYFRRAVYDTFVAYARRLNDTKTGVELVLNLASTYDFERRALDALVESRDDVQRVLAEEGRGLSEAGQVRLKAFVLDKLYREIVDLNGTLGVSFGDLSTLYLRREEEIYRRVLDMGGEARNRALWHWGRLRWELGDPDNALTLWKRVDMSQPLASRAFRRICGVIQRYDQASIAKSARFANDVDEWLLAEAALDRQALLNRHIKYRTWAKRSERP